MNYSHSCGLGSSTEMESLKEEQIICRHMLRMCTVYAVYMYCMLQL